MGANSTFISSRPCEGPEAGTYLRLLFLSISFLYNPHGGFKGTYLHLQDAMLLVFEKVVL
ncbi:hypothetical protein LguiB_012237 [Lonicera macranthoides]